MSKKKIVVKIGTNSMTTDEGLLDEELLAKLVGQVAELRREHDVLLVSSGAMGAGRSIIKKELKHDEVTKRQIYAVVGQVKLMETYRKLFSEHGLFVAQVLATKQDFENRAHYLNTKNCIDSLFSEEIIPVMNENDFVCVEELMFTDNDELAGMVSKMIFADTLIILSNIDGVYDETGAVVHEFRHDEAMPAYIVPAEKSSFGKGGMQNKFIMAQRAASDGSNVVIANSKTENVLTRVISGEKLGSRFLANK